MSPLSRANSIGSREPLFQTLMTPKGSKPVSPAFSSAANTPKSHRHSKGWAVRAVHGLTIASSVLLLLLTASMYLPDSDLYTWSKSGCPKKVLELNNKMNATLAAAKSARLIAADLGNPVDRRPKTAIVNIVRYHTEVVASLIYHFTKLNHNVTVFSRDDELGIERVINPFHWKGIRRYERFYDYFYEFDTIVLATFPTCHLEIAANLVATGLPQRYLAVVHNPEQLAADDAAAAMVAAEGNIQLLTITPHVNAYTNSILEAEGLAEVLRSQWFAPIFPVLFPEDCNNPHLRSPSGVAAAQPACNRSSVWQESEMTAPAAVLDADDEEWASGRRKLSAAAKNSAAKKRREKKEKELIEAAATQMKENKGFLGGPPGPRRQGFCVQGKLDPTRRSYDSLFADLVARREQLLASEFSLVLQGKVIGKQGKDILELPDGLEEDGLVRRYTALPFQEFYEVLHSCIAIMPAFASEAYYIHKGSSSVAASFIAGTPLIVTPRVLASYSFLDASAVFLVPDGTGDVEAMEAVMKLPQEVIEAKLSALNSLRHQVYDRNLALFQAVLGDKYLYKKKGNKKASDEKAANYQVMYYDASGPLWTP